MSDEEKKALKELNEIKELVEEDLKYADYNVTATLDQIDLESLVTVLNLIEKQSKEIEELKAINKMQKYRIEVIDEREFISKDTIKSKIEELENQKRQWVEDRDNKHKDSEIIYAIEILKSLLEKE